jgi:hypothetical protein
VLFFIYRFLSIKLICSFVLLIILGLGLGSCSDRIESEISTIEKPTSSISAGKLLEVAPPKLIRELGKSLERYQPQVTILTPPRDRVFDDTTVEVKFQVNDLPIFKDADLGLGPHLEVVLDNEPALEVYDLDKPLSLENLTPGTHTLRVFASRPWHESFKNEGAYAQTTFHILTKTGNNQPNPSLPLLTYNQPQGNYGAEPILLDFYLTNAPLHIAAKNNPEIADWRIRVTVNGQSFVLDDWQPIYLTGFEKGNNWVQLEFLDEKGDRVENAFNNTVRLITYNPKEQNALSKLVKGDISLEYARSIIEPGYKANLEPLPTPTPTITPTVEPEPSLELPSPTPQETPAEVEEPSATETEISPQPSVKPEETTTPFEETPSAVQPETTPIEEPEEFNAPTAEPTPAVDAETYNESSEEPKSSPTSRPSESQWRNKVNDFFKRLQPSQTINKPSPVQLEPESTPAEPAKPSEPEETVELSKPLSEPM